MEPGDLVKIKKQNVIIWDLNDEVNPIMVEETKINQVVLVLGGPPDHLSKHVKSDVSAYLKILTPSGVIGWIHFDNVVVASQVMKQE